MKMRRRSRIELPISNFTNRKKTKKKAKIHYFSSRQELFGGKMRVFGN